MDDDAWTWAELNRQQLNAISNAEQTLGADYLLAFQPRQTSDSPPGEVIGDDVQPADLSESQIDCLRGLEQQIQATVVAYKQRDS